VYNIIAIDGHDGVGKSTLADSLANDLKNQGYETYHHMITYGGLCESSVKINENNLVDKPSQDKIISGLNAIVAQLKASNKKIIFDRGIVTMMTLLPEERWGELYNALSQIKTIVVTADPDIVESRIAARGEDDSIEKYDNRHFLKVYEKIANDFALPMVNTSESTIDENIRKLKNIAKNKSVYFAGHMKIDFEKGDISADTTTEDYRCQLLPFDKIKQPGIAPILIHGTNYNYNGPYFYYPTKNGSLSLDDATIVDNEFKNISQSDEVVFYIEDKFSAGTTVEMMIAAQLGKKLRVYCIEDDKTDSTLYKTRSWYPLIASKKILEQNNCKNNMVVKYVKNQKEFLTMLKADMRNDYLNINHPRPRGMVR
jgi:thymidylate kinase